MNERQRHALLNPLSAATESTEPYRTIEKQPDGNLLVLILAVDR